MSATETALRVAEWAIGGSGPPPQGDLLDPETLSHPEPLLGQVLGELAAVAAARLRLSSPVLGVRGCLGAGEAVLAAALGVMHTPELLQTLLQIIPPLRYPLQWVTRHSLVGQALPFFPDADAEVATPPVAACLGVSPLTALLTHPPEGQRSELLAFSQELLQHGEGRRLLQLALAKPTPNPHIRHWRRELLERLRLTEENGRDFVIDVYEAAMVFYEQDTLEQVRTARTVLSHAGADEACLRNALAVAVWWGPLRALERSYPDALRARRYLGYGYREGIALYQLAQRLTGGAL